jgi:hypothetical protein
VTFSITPSTFAVLLGLNGADIGRIKIPRCGSSPAVQSRLILAARITLLHFLVSSEITLPKSAGNPPSTVPPRSASRALSFGSATLTLTQSLDDLFRRALRSANAEPYTCLVARQGFAESRNVRQHRRARRRRDSQGAELASPDISDRREQRTEINLHIAGEKRGKHLCAAIRYVKEIDASHRLEHFAGDMGRGSDSGRRKPVRQPRIASYHDDQNTILLVVRKRATSRGNSV